MTVAAAWHNVGDSRGALLLLPATGRAAKPHSKAGTLTFPPAALILSHSIENWDLLRANKQAMAFTEPCCKSRAGTGSSCRSDKEDVSAMVWWHISIENGFMSLKAGD